MKDFIAILLLVIGFVCLVKGADWFVDGAAGIAEKLRVPAIIVGLTIVSFGTSAPELATSIISSVQGSADIALGNVIGSNITNILLILGVAAVICPLTVQKLTLRFDFFVLLGSMALFVLLGGFDNVIGHLDGWILFILSLVYTIALIMIAIRESKKQGTMAALNDHEVVIDKDENPAKGFHAWYDKMKAHAWFLTVIMLVGLALVVVGALYCVIPSVEYLAERIGIPEKIISLTVLAIGTSLPELVTCVVAAKKGETDIAVGDIVGSNIFNVLRTVGLSAMIIPLAFQPSFVIDGCIALAAALLLVILGYLKGNKVRRWGGIVMLCGFLAYYVYLFAFM